MPGGAGQDALRLFFGLAAVAREAAKAGPALAKLRNGDTGGAAVLALSRLVNAVTDSSGLTSGTPHRPPSPRPHPPPSPEAPPIASAGSKRPDAPLSHWDSNRTPDLLPPKGPSPRLDGGGPSKGPDKRSEAPLSAAKMDSSPEDSKEAPRTAQATPERDAFSPESVRASILEIPRATETEGRPQAARRTVKKRMPRERRVPSTPLGRALGFAGLGVGLAVGTLKESAKRLWNGEGGDSSSGQSVLSPFLTEENAERLAVTLCRMRGAALKLGQMLSIQDDTLLPPALLAALETVRQSADVMPRGQLETVLSNELGADWKSTLKSFDHVPLAAASIGQVHKAVLTNGMEVAMKIQYPGVANSINSDIENVKRLLTYTNFLPKGLYLDQAMKVAKEELARECDYELEARSQKRFRELLLDEEGVYVPMVVDELSRKRVLTTELVAGVPIDKVAEMEQSVRDRVGKKLLSLTLNELFVYRFMQTDPNWGNFLYDESKETINLIDFGAARDYPKSFVDNYLQMVFACANRDAAKVIEMSCRLGFLTGEESSEMLDAHTEAGFMVGLPFSKAGGFDFRSTNLTRRVSELGAVMLRHRLKAPPDEVYSLHRKLSGAFLACIKLGAVVPCREMLLEVYNTHNFSHHSENNLAQVATV